MIELLIIGDSLSSPYGPTKHWPQYFEPEVAVVRNLAQAGLTMRDFELPGYIMPQPGTERAIAVVYIGTNDIGSGFAAAAYGEKLRELLLVLQHRRYEVWLVQPPSLDLLDEGLLGQYRLENEWAADGLPLMDPGWGTESTVDGVHPGAMEHYYLYAWFKQELGL